MTVISVIIPTYKPGNYLFECLDSLKNQTLSFQKFEIIIILNGCKSPYEEVLRTYIQKELDGMDIRLIQLDEGGVSNARNFALEHADGRYICFIDDDDRVSSNYLESLLSLAVNNTIVVSNVYTFTNNVNSVGEDYLTKCFKCYVNSGSKGIFRLRSFMSSACCKLIPKDVIGERRFDTHFKTGEDALFMAMISDKIESIQIVPDETVVYYRRIRLDSASRIKKSLGVKLRNCLRLLTAYWKIYWGYPLHFNIFFFISRCVATCIAVLR